MEHACAVILHLSFLKVKVLGLVISYPHLQLAGLLAVLRLVCWPAKKEGGEIKEEIYNVFKGILTLQS